MSRKKHQAREEEDLRITRASIKGTELLLVSCAAEQAPTASVLSPAEIEVARLLLAGCSQREIAEARSSSSHTVANQIQSIYRKYGVNTREELALRLLAGVSSVEPADPSV